MKFTQRLVGILSVILACVIGGGLLVLTAENAQAESRIPKPKLSYDIPVNPNPSPYNPETDFGLGG
jgi:hypothetical protein